MTIVDLMSVPATPAAARAIAAKGHGAGTSTRRQRLAASQRRLLPPQVCIVDPNAALRAGLPLVLTGFTFTGMYATVEILLSSHPAADLVLFEPDSAAGPDTAAIRSLRRAGYRVCVYTRETRQAVLARCIAAGARGLMAKSDPIGALATALRRIAEGGTAISPQFAAATTRAPGADLTGRQLQILAGRARGETFLSIARRLEISERTAQDHWSAITRRFDTFLKTHSPADLERSLGLDAGVAPLDDQR